MATPTKRKVEDKKADKKYPPDDPDEPVDADEEQEERDRKGRMKKIPDER